VFDVCRVARWDDPPPSRAGVDRRPRRHGAL